MNADYSIPRSFSQNIETKPVVEVKVQRPRPVSSEITSVKDMQRAELAGERIPVSEEQVIRSIERAIKAIQGSKTSLEFSVHEKTKQIMVKVLNSETGEIIREIPPEKTMDFVAKLWEMAGILIDERR